MITQEGQLRQWITDPRVRAGLRVAGYGLGGFCMSATSLANSALPLSLGLSAAMTGWRTLVTALGSLLGYWIFWGNAGLQGFAWAAGGCALGLFFGKRRESREQNLLLPAMAAFWVSACGLFFQVFFRDTTPVSVYLLRVLLGGSGTALCLLIRRRESAWADALGAGMGVLALAQIAPFGFSLGYLGAGVLGLAAGFPGAALAGVALDLARITDVPMTAVLCLTYFLGQLPVEKKWMRCCSPGAAFLILLTLTGGGDLLPLPGLVIGGVLGGLLPARAEPQPRKGEVGLAQVRLEIMAGVLSQTQQLLLEAPEVPIDEEALLQRTRERACGSCPQRKGCQESAKLSLALLHRPLTDGAGLPCRKPNRLLLELRRSQEQLRHLHADRDRRREYRQAVVQQYQFLGDYLRQTADQLPKRGQKLRLSFKAEVQIASCSKEEANGDKCQCFSGTGGKYYIALCDGMGTGLGAAQEAQAAMTMLKKMLTAGFPAEYALRSINSLCCLRSRAGAVTVDLVEIALDSGKAALYKWGAAPSWLLRGAGAEKIGTAGPPPGMSVHQTRETVDRLSLRRGEVLILMSDGVDGEDALYHLRIAPGEPLGEMAAKLLECGSQEESDDATVALIRLNPST